MLFLDPKMKSLLLKMNCLSPKKRTTRITIEEKADLVEIEVEIEEIEVEIVEDEVDPLWTGPQEIQTNPLKTELSESLIVFQPLQRTKLRNLTLELVTGEPKKKMKEVLKMQKKEIDSSEVKVDEVKAEEVVEPEPKTLTLKEYEEQLAALAPKIDAPKRREAGEGEKSDLHKYVVLKRDDDDEFKQLHNNNIKIKEKKKKQNKKTVVPLADVLNVNNVDDRKGKKPYNSKYNNNNNRKPKKVNISIEDTDSFPALK